VRSRLARSANRVNTEGRLATSFGARLTKLRKVLRMLNRIVANDIPGGLRSDEYMSTDPQVGSWRIEKARWNPESCFIWIRIREPAAARATEH